MLPNSPNVQVSSSIPSMSDVHGGKGVCIATCIPALLNYFMLPPSPIIKAKQKRDEKQLAFVHHLCTSLSLQVNESSLTRGI